MSAASSKGRVAIARSTLDACAAGHYDHAGRRVEIPGIDDAKAGTLLYEAGDRFDDPVAQFDTTFSLTNESSNEAIARLASAPHLGVLNFASAKNPGGGFLGGSQAQEECLARSSALYPCLLEVPEHYERNRALHSPVYLDLAIYSPRVPYFRTDAGEWFATPVFASTITCAAPNAGASAKRDDHDPDRIIRALRVRANLIIAIAATHGITHLVLGAWGAGVFRNDPAIVARMLIEPLRDRYRGVFAEVIFAIYGGPGENYDAFERALR